MSTTTSASITSAEAARLLGIKTSSVRQLAQKKQITKTAAGVFGDPHGSGPALYDRDSVLRYRTLRDSRRPVVRKSKTRRTRPTPTANLATEFAKLEGMLAVTKDLPRAITEQFTKVKAAAGL